MDGVLANFTEGYTRMAGRVNPEAPIVSDYQRVLSWDFRDWYWKEGYTEELNDNVWERIMESDRFWFTLKPLWPFQMNFLRDIHRNNVVFMTRRDGVEPWFQTVKWLEFNGIKEPLVVRVKSGEEKGHLCNDLGIRVLVDDSPKHIKPAIEAGLIVVKMCWPYNVQVKTPYAAHNLKDALDTAIMVNQRGF